MPLSSNGKAAFLLSADVSSILNGGIMISHYCGDGSASLSVERSPQRAERKDELASENGDCFGEPTDGGIELILKDGVLYYEESVYKYVDGKYTHLTGLVRVPMKNEVIDDEADA
jgi:hypothetical protein